MYNASKASHLCVVPLCGSSVSLTSSKMGLQFNSSPTDARNGFQFGVMVYILCSNVNIITPFAWAEIKSLCKC